MIPRLFVVAVMLTMCGWSFAAASPAPLPTLAVQRPLAGAPAQVRARLVYVANAAANSITAYPESAVGDVRPVVTLAGPHTSIVNPVAVAHDSQGMLFVACGYPGLQVLVFAPGTTGDAAPVRSFQASHYTYFGSNVSVAPTSVAVDRSGYTYVGEQAANLSDSAVVAVYGPAAHGNVAPLRFFAAGSPFTRPQVAVDGTGAVYVVEPFDRFNPPSLGKFSAFGDGNVYLGGPPDLSQRVDFTNSTGGVVVAPRWGNVYAINNDHITIFNPYFTKGIGFIGGPATGIGLDGENAVTGVAIDGSGQVYVTRPGVNGTTLTDSVYVFSAGALGNTAPSRAIAGPHTGLSDPVALTLIDAGANR